MYGKRGMYLKHFVLSPTKNDAYGVASRVAMIAYAEAVKEENPGLAYDLKMWEIGCKHNIAKAVLLKDANVNPTIS